jgi:NAD(P)-dependent dehydrogenase (short-subunit alcohol dehydrogenase family)
MGQSPADDQQPDCPELVEGLFFFWVSHLIARSKAALRQAQGRRVLLESFGMTQMRFDGRTAIVTGAGGNPSLGRAFALLLASRGANVVVNDIGSDPEMRGYPGEASAESVADEIRAAGGKAVADTHSVASEAGGKAIVQCALDHFGSLDVLVNNAAISITAAFDVMTPRDFQRHIDTNLMGPYHLCHAAWPHMKAAGYGRIVNITSGSMTGFSGQTAYGASKGALWSLTRALAAEGGPHGIKVNAVSPGAFTRLVASMMEETSPLLMHTKANLPAELSAPAVALLAHQDCPVTGECIDAVGGEVWRSYMARTPGISDRTLTMESLTRQWDAVIGKHHSGELGIASFDTTEWQLKPYTANTR